MWYISAPKQSKKICYACENNLTGYKKCYDLQNYGYCDEGGKCNCVEWECRCKDVLIYECFCPLCNAKFEGSDFLVKNIQDPKHLWLANIITHYRHEHRKWDNQWRYIQFNCREGVYEKEKDKVNNQIKRALLGNKIFTQFFLKNNIGKSSFLALKNNEEKTIKVISKSKILN